MSILIFIIVLAVLILVHEFGHFITAKKSGVRVDEFGIGFPPRLFKLFKWGETEFTVNSIPFGGFVKIHGENPEEDNEDIRLSNPDADQVENFSQLRREKSSDMIFEAQKSGTSEKRTEPYTQYGDGASERSNADMRRIREPERNLSNKPKLTQALVIFAGILFNIIFAWALISFGYMYGLPTPVETSTVRPLQNISLVVTSVLPDSPAQSLGVKSGDKIIGVSEGKKTLTEINPDTFSTFVTESSGPISLEIKRGDKIIQHEILPKSGIVEDKKAIGISMSMLGILKLPVHLALWEGAKTTVSVLWAVTAGLGHFLGQIFSGKADFSQVTGPVGIVGLVGDASNLGFIYLIQFTAFISLNLAVINFLPFPALDGGRLLFLLIEAIRRKRISPKIVNISNAIGFIILLLLMVVVTIHDVIRL